MVIFGALVCTNILLLNIFHLTEKDYFFQEQSATDCILSFNHTHTCIRKTSALCESGDEFQGCHDLQSPYHIPNKEIVAEFHTDSLHESVGKNCVLIEVKSH